MYHHNRADPAADPATDPAGAADPAEDPAGDPAARQELSFAILPSPLDALSDVCAASHPMEMSDNPITPAAEALAETASQEVAFVAPVARRTANELVPAKRQRKGGAKRFAHIELDDEDGPPQIRSLPLEAGPFAGVWVPDGDKFEIIGDLINDSVAGEIYQQVLYRCTSGYIKSKYICYEKEI